MNGAFQVGEISSQTCERKLRSQLAQAIERRGIALKARDRARYDLQQGQKLGRRIEDELGTFDIFQRRTSFDREIGLFLFEMPYDLSKLLSDRAEASKTLTIQHRDDKAQDRLRAAEALFIETDQAVRMCAFAVLAAKAEKLRLNPTLSRNDIDAIRAWLVWVAASQITDPENPASAAWEFLPPNSDARLHDQKIVQQWKAWFQNLIENCEAEIDD